LADLFEAKIINVTIARSAPEVYAFAADPANLVKWATGLGSMIEMVAGQLVAQSPRGQVKIRFTPRNELGVLDHYVSPEPGVEIYVPMRVVTNGSGSEVIFTLYRRPGVTAADFQRDAELVHRDLLTLKKLLEEGTGGNRAQDRRPS
jgi:hypothetical protein